MAAPSPPQMSFEEPVPCRGRCEVWALGKVMLLRSRVRDLRIVRTARQVRTAPAPVLLLNLQQHGEGHYEQFGSRMVGTPGRIVPLDLNVPYRVRWGGDCDALGLRVPLDSLCLSAATVRRATPRLSSSPVHSLVANYIVALSDSVDDLVTGPALSVLGDSCVEMVRALLLSAAQGADDEVLPDTALLTRIRRYVLEHLTDPELSPERIARAHHISVRYLYKLCGRGELSLEQWIITQRLERARGELARPEIGYRSIATISRICGFRDPSHFTRRFRAAYGISPSEWRRSVLGRAAD
ncbi:helix-turn-helix domain-containing protein [Nocardia sp. CDC159]|uniref:Helix-turn-helix domain-containing protein n=1 Tax=Nocardia pulmonis TaxID=2951408 RepID=A0A9X2EAN0_9NOCA|nr:MULTISPECIES: helix-turn-helix domain-containing protein [Nocardia]MCM6777419.1 helix-turn-helix domain-containing protein [Nocardia pulmonis]MCM6790304.1 helix-turn-helix domain-containing protein [Nocardia sp. CDC159]